MNTIDKKSKLIEVEEKMKLKNKNVNGNHFEKLIGMKKGESQSAFSFMPYNENSILSVEETNKNIFFLMRNGTVIYLSQDENGVNRKLLEMKMQIGVPMQIKINVRIVDLVCGNEHCIAKGSNNKIYSWGSNSYGQLGLTGFPMNPDSEKEEPTEIKTFNNIKIGKIFAINVTSYAISDNKRIFGWGSNENGQLGNLDKNDLNMKFRIPVEIFTEVKPSKDLNLFIDKKAKKVYIAEFRKKEKNLSETLEVTKNKHLYSKEHELKDELEKYKAIKNQIGHVRASVEDYDHLIKDIRNLIIKFEDKINQLELKNKREFNDESNAEQINFFDTKIQFITDKERGLEQSIKNTEFNLDKNKIKFKTSSRNPNQEKENEEIEKNRTNQETVMNAPRDQFNSDRLVKVGDIISRVNTELQFQKHLVLNDHLRSVEETKKKEVKVKKLKECIKTFQRAIEITHKKIHNLSFKSSTAEVEIATAKINQEISNFNTNSLKNINKIINDSDSILKNLKKSMSNMDDLEEKIYNLSLDKNNSFIIKISDMFNKNIRQSKENNILMEKAIHMSKGLYKNLLEKIITNENPSNFNELKDKIDSFKRSNREEKELEDSDVDYEDDLKEVLSDESFNY